MLRSGKSTLVAPPSDDFPYAAGSEFSETYAYAFPGFASRSLLYRASFYIGTTVRGHHEMKNALRVFVIARTDQTMHFILIVFIYQFDFYLNQKNPEHT